MTPTSLSLAKKLRGLPKRYYIYWWFLMAGKWYLVPNAKHGKIGVVVEESKPAPTVEEWLEILPSVCQIWRNGNKFYCSYPVRGVVQSSVAKTPSDACAKARIFLQEQKGGK